MSTVGGGKQNFAFDTSTTVGGGNQNQALENYATVSGGYLNFAGGYHATIAGGGWNQTSDTRATVGGGAFNEAGGYAATIPGGYADTTAGDYSLAAGYKVRLTSSADNTFGFGSNFTTSTPNAVIFYHSDTHTRVGINKTDPFYAIHLPDNADASGWGYANDWKSASSIRWKENIDPIEDALDKVLSLRGVYFDWKESKKHDIGMIAEEVGKVIPEVVVYEENGVDAEGLSYGRLTALLVEAIKEQQKEIEALREDINALKTEDR